MTRLAAQAMLGGAGGSSTGSGRLASTPRYGGYVFIEIRFLLSSQIRVYAEASPLQLGCDPANAVRL